MHQTGDIDEILYKARPSRLATLELQLEDATEQLKGTPEWDLVQGLKEERKLLQKKLERAIDGTLHWAQPRML